MKPSEIESEHLATGVRRPVPAVCLLVFVATIAVAGASAADHLQIRALLDEGQYATAEARARGLLAEETSDSLRTARTIDLLVEALIRQVEQADLETQELAERAVAIKERLLGPTDPGVATSLLNLAVVLTDTDEKERADELFSRALAIRRSALGEDQPDVAEVLAEQGRFLILAGRGDDASPLLERSLAIREAALGPLHRDVAHSLYLLSYARESAGELPAAESLSRRCLEIQEQVLGPDHPEVGWTLRALAAVLLRQLEWEEAIPLLERALAILERTYGPDHGSVLDLLNNLALAVGKLGEIERSREIHERVLSTLERSHGSDDPILIASLMNLGVLNVDGGDVYDAVGYFRRALDIAEKASADRHALARHCLNLAVATKVTGDLVESRELYERAQELMEASVGPEHHDLAVVLGQFAQLLRDEGRFAEARQKHERALAILEKVHGGEHLLIAHNLANLGEIYWLLQDRVAARRELERALAMLERVLPPSHGNSSYVLGTLGVLLGEMGDFEKANEYLQRKLELDRERGAPGGVADALIAIAELGDKDPSELRELYARALALREEAFDPDHPDIASSLVALASACRDAGDREAAAPLLARALEIQEKTFGPLHPQLGRTELELARLQLQLGDSAAAFDSALHSERILRDHLRLTLRSLIERRALGLAGSRASGIDLALSIASDDNSGGTVERAWDAVVRSRAVVFDEMAGRARAAVDSGDEAMDRLARDLSRARQRVANLVVRGPDEEHPERYLPLLDRALLEKERAERGLAELSDSFREQSAQDEIGWGKVSGARPPDGGIVAFVSYDRTRVVEGKGDYGKLPRNLVTTPSYLAFVLSPSDDRASIVPLGPADEIHALVAAWRAAVAVKPPAARAARTRAERKYREAGEALRRKIWDPAAAALGDADRVLVVPDGALNLINLATLPAEDDRYLVETKTVIHTLSAERDVVRTAAGQARGEGLLALGGPDFDTTPGSDAVRTAAAYRGQLADCEDFGKRRFEPLPGSLDEIERIAGMWSAAAGESVDRMVTLTGSRAREDALKTLAPGRRVLHIATHGFFLGRNCRAAGDDNLLLLSGLALAGSNNRDAAPVDAEDGILTSEEIASLGLHGVEWVVLSACDTGLGEVLPREGVLGLRRAFQLAGAESLIMSLWSVQDEAALEWMDNLYSGRGDGLSTAEAVRRAGVEMIERRRRAGRSTHPFYWGAFVATGDWR
jgi:CHAT domain-containing protein/Tfp pilus assembly protein PilF